MQAYTQQTILALEGKMIRLFMLGKICDYIRFHSFPKITKKKERKTRQSRPTFGTGTMSLINKVTVLSLITHVH